MSAAAGPVPPPLADLVRDVRRVLVRRRLAGVLAPCAWGVAVASLALAGIATLLSPPPVTVALALPLAGLAVGAALAARGWPDPLDCARYADRAFAGESAYTTLMQLSADDAARPAAAVLERFVAARVPASRAAIRAAPGPAWPRLALSVATASSLLAILVLALLPASGPSTAAEPALERSPQSPRAAGGPTNDAAPPGPATAPARSAPPAPTGSPGARGGAARDEAGVAAAGGRPAPHRGPDGAGGTGEGGLAAGEGRDLSSGATSLALALAPARVPIAATAAGTGPAGVALDAAETAPRTAPSAGPVAAAVAPARPPAAADGPLASLFAHRYLVTAGHP